MAQIKTYCRIKPTDKVSSFFDWDEDRVCIGVRTAGASGNSFDRTSTITHDTEFSHVFGPTVTQSEIFDVVASNIVEGCLAGYNGTIFAYGQTGSGKTYTIEGGSRTYADRGMAPRALSTVYQSIQNLTSSDVTIHVSYLEIYQETGYDLLNPTARMSGVVAHLPKVSVRDGPGNSCIIRNLSTHLAADENIAQNLLHQGRVSRRIAETSSNQRSSRSHAIFTIYLTQHDRKSDVIRKSKLHLVDLAGSERAAKSGIKGNQLAEAKSINLSLHHLEGVIIALQKIAQSVRRERRQRSSSAGPYRQKRISSAGSSRSLPYDRRSVGELANPRHVPYRNSLLTMLLKDSLGGNCLTAMVATLSVQDINIGESLSTCRFAQRVACIKNHASRNEEVDDKMIIKRLRKRVIELEKEIKNLKQGIQSPQETDNIAEVSSSVCNECKRRQDTANLSTNVIQNAPVLEDPTDIPVTDPAIDRDTRKSCVKIMHGFIGGKIRDPVASGEGIKNVDQFRVCLQLLREMLMRSYAVGQRSKGRQVLQHPNSRSAESTAIRSKSSPNLQTAVTVGIPRKDDRYQSPFEKKRENVIKKASARVERRHTDQKIQKKNLLEFQTSIREQQLMLLHKELNGKVLKAKSQVARQRALLRNLKDDLGDTGEIEMEKTALKQLIKRGTRYENRLQVVNEQLKIIDQHYRHQKKADGHPAAEPASAELRNDNPSTQNQSNNPPIRSERDGGRSAELEVTSSFKESLANKNRGIDGQVNTRKVLETLKKEEKKQAKIQSVLDEVRLESVNSHLALKEQATRQKLTDFREMLKQSKEGSTSGGNTNSDVLQTASSSSRNLVKASTYECNTSDKDSKEKISMTSTPKVDVYREPKFSKTQPKNAWNMRQEDVAQRTGFHYNSTNSKSEIMTPKDSSATVVSNDFSAGANKSGIIAQNFQLSASPDYQSSKIHHQASKTSFDTALDSMLQDTFVSSSGTPTLTNSVGASRMDTPTNHVTSLNLANENNPMQTLSGDGVKKIDYSTPEKTSEPEHHHSFVKKSDDLSELQQKLSEYLGVRQSSTPKARPTMMSSSHGSLHSSVGIPSFYNPSQDKLASYSTTSPKHSAQDLRSRDFLQRSLTTLNSSDSLSYDSESLPFDRAYRQMFPSSVSLPSYTTNRSHENEVNEFSFKSNTKPKQPSDISLPLAKDSLPSSFLPEPSKYSAAPMEDKDREVSFIRAVKENKLRVKKICEAQEAATVIQKVWKSYVKKKQGMSAEV